MLQLNITTPLISGKKNITTPSKFSYHQYIEVVRLIIQTVHKHMTEIKIIKWQHEECITTTRKPIKKPNKW